MSSGHGKADVVASFQNFDLNKDGLISLEDLRGVLFASGDWTEERTNGLFCVLDIDNDGFLDYGKFINWAFDPIPNEDTSVKLEVKKKEEEDIESKEDEYAELLAKVDDLEDRCTELDADNWLLQAEKSQLQEALREAEDRIEFLEESESRWREKNSILRLEVADSRLYINRLGARVGDLEADMVQKLMAQKFIVTVRLITLADSQKVVTKSLGGNEHTFDVSPGSMLVQTLQLELAARMSVDKCFITLVTEMGDPIQDLTKDVVQAINDLGLGIHSA